MNRKKSQLVAGYAKQRRRRLITAAVSVGLVAGLVGVTNPAGALDCGSSDDRNSVQCLNNNRTIKGSKKNSRYSAQSGISFTIDDRGGSDTLTLERVSARDVQFKADGKDLIVSYRKGSVRIKNHLGAGRIETIEFTGSSSRSESGRGRGTFQTANASNGGDSFVQLSVGGITVRERIDPDDPRGLFNATERANRKLRDKQGDRRSDGTNGGQVRGADPGVGRRDVPDSF